MPEHSDSFIVDIGTTLLLPMNHTKNKTRKTKCRECGKEFSYHGSTSSLKYHLIHRHNIKMSTNLNQVKRQSPNKKKSKVWDYFAEPYDTISSYAMNVPFNANLSETNIHYYDFELLFPTTI
ncbi:hypothetical protein Glove_248g9 [Diversispora epigaea]|uniref:BED-type domain-containing protein n=1 Tax=Diversispora epigaea TaxID=1348612 RepID=A0A397I891_9GLOM|nr:hypothetical protein Glove_248g9 [Diversispora epigaea]